MRIVFKDLNTEFWSRVGVGSVGGVGDVIERGHGYARMGVLWTPLLRVI